MPRPLRPESLFPLCLLAAAIPAQAPVNWTPGATGPSARAGGFMVFDSVRDRAVLFGGLGTSNLNDTWEHDGSTWTLRSTPVAPAARNNGAFAFDSLRGRMLVFGGFNGSYLSDLWSWNGSAWSQVPASGPSGRTGQAMAYDRVRDRIVLFGGSPGGTNRFGDTWEFDGTSWLQVAVTGPQPRTTRMVYDEARLACLVFGGSTGAGVLNDTWTWNGTSWTQVFTAGAPPARWRHALEFDRSRQRVVLHAGNVPSTATNLSDTWVLAGNSWTQLSPSGTPAARFFPGVTYDESRDTVLVFGGSNGSALADCHELAPAQRASYRSNGAGCVSTLGSAPNIRRNGTLPQIGTTFAVELTGMPAPGVAILTVGFSNTVWSGLPLPLDLGILGMVGCQLRQDLFDATVLIGSSGTASWSLAIPDQASILGAQFFHQAMVADAAANSFGAVLSNSMRAVVGCR